MDGKFNGIFDMTGFESKADDDLMTASAFGEEAEFAPNSNAKNNVDNGTGDPNVSVPGGLKEQPTAKPEGGEKEIPVPGGLHEAPSNSGPGGFVKVGIPGGTTMTSDVYNDYLKRLQHTFKEASEALEMLSQVNVLTESAEQKQARLIEESVGNSIVEALENGPLFEAVDREDKEDVKAIVKKLRNKLSKHLQSEGVFFRVPNVWAQVIVGGILTPVGGIGAYDFARGLNTMISTRMWQILGLCHMESGNITELTKSLTEKFKEELGDYKVLATPTYPSIADMWRQKFGWKNQKNTYMLLVDRKLPSEIKKLQEELAKEAEKIAKEAEEKAAEKKNDKKDD